MKKKDNIKSLKSQMPFEDMFMEQDTLDIHGFGPMIHSEIHKLITNFIEDSYNRSLLRIKIITGKGNVVRPMALRILKSSKYVSEYRFSGYFTGQNGSLEIILKSSIK